MHDESQKNLPQMSLPLMSSRLESFPDASVETACKILEELTRQARDLLTFLMREHSALKQRAHAELFEITKQKQARLRALESSFQQEKRLIGHLQAEASAHKLRGYTLNTRPPVLARLWEDLRTVLHHCRYQNSANGELIRVLGCHTRGILSLMQGALSGNEVYDGSGKRRSSGISSYSNTA
jgi:flagellar biosynthesis/type III secretory pathway chaperone